MGNVKAGEQLDERMSKDGVCVDAYALASVKMGESAPGCQGLHARGMRS